MKTIFKYITQLAVNPLAFSLIISVCVHIGCNKNQHEKKEANSAAPKKTSQPLPTMDTTRVNLSKLPPIESIVLKNSYSSQEEVLKLLHQALKDSNSLRIMKLLPDFKEYSQLYYYLPDPDLNPNSGDFMATLYVNGNRKNIPRWAKDYTEKECVEITASEAKKRTKGPGYELLSDIKVECRDSKAVSKSFPIFKTLLKIGDKYLIWSILET